MLKKSDEPKQLNKILIPNDPVDSVVKSIADISIEVSHMLANFRIDKRYVGETGNQNTSGDNTFKMDIAVNDLFLEKLEENENVYSVLSEELESNYVLNEKGRYIVTLDPLDGSKNINSNMPTATIFSILDREKNILQEGKNILVAGYVLYSSATVLVLTRKDGVQGYTLAQNDQYTLTHNKMRIPNSSKYVFMYHRAEEYSDYVFKFIDEIKKDKEELGKGFFLFRAVAVELHEILINGGVVILPESSSRPTGSLRHIYEVNPLSFLIRRAGGGVSSQGKDPLQIQPKEIHSRLPIVMGSTNLVELFNEIYSKK